MVLGIVNELLSYMIGGLGVLGTVSNGISLFNNWKKRSALPSQLYIALNIIDFIISLVSVLVPILSYFVQLGPTLNGADMVVLGTINYLNPTSALWTTVVCVVRLIIICRPFYKIKTRLFWGLSTLAVILQPIIVTVIPYSRPSLVGQSALHFLSVLIVTVWTCVKLCRNASVSSSTDNAKRRAAVTVTIVAMVFLIDTAFGLSVILIFFYIYPDTNKGEQFRLVTYIWAILIVLNSLLNPVILMARSTARSSVRGSTNSTQAMNRSAHHSNGSARQNTARAVAERSM